jgi:hypothetical protein
MNLPEAAFGHAMASAAETAGMEERIFSLGIRRNNYSWMIISK